MTSLEPRTFRPAACLAAVAVAILTTVAVLIFTGGLTRRASAQQDFQLDRRLALIEQRFTMIEARLGRLEQNSLQVPPIGAASRVDAELNVLRSQNETLAAQTDALRIRLGEVECALLALDERTLTADERRRSTPSAAEPCRQRPSAPIRLSSRPPR